MPEIREESFSPSKHMQDLQETSGQCVSLYLPLNGAREGATVFATRLKAALKRAQQQLAEEFGEEAAANWPPKELTGFAKTLRKGPQNGGIAIFSANGKTRVYHAPEMWNEHIHAGTEFYIRPLLSMIMRPPAFYLLALSEQNVRLLRCTADSAEEVLLPESIPGNLAEATHFKQPDHRLEHGSASSHRQGDERGIRFGTSADEEKHDLYLRQFFSKIDSALRPLFTNQQHPLMLAGVKRHFTLYSDVNTYEKLLEQGVEGSPEWLSSLDLHLLATEAWEAYQKAVEAEVLKELNRADSQAKLVKDALKLLPAVEAGRVHHLVLSGEKSGDATDNLVNHLAIAALRQRSRISVLNNHSVPGGCAAGILRYGREERGTHAKAS